MTRLLHFTDMHLRWHLPGTATDPLRRSREMPAVLERLGAGLKAHSPAGLVLSGAVLDVPAPVVAGSAPAAASASDMARPTPRPPPVTNATRPANDMCSRAPDV